MKKRVTTATGFVLSGNLIVGLSNKEFNKLLRIKISSTSKRDMKQLFSLLRAAPIM